MRSMFVKKHCPKCNGNIYLESDNYGCYEQCLQCGYSHDIKSPSEIFNTVWHAPTKDTTSYVRVKDSLASGTGG
ncbi:hypothetical protein ACFLU8_02900 [Chloroflexota bacterium]